MRDKTLYVIAGLGTVVKVTSWYGADGPPYSSTLPEPSPALLLAGGPARVGAVRIARRR